MCGRRSVWISPGAQNLPQDINHDRDVYRHPREFAIKNSNARVFSRGRGAWALLELTDALVIYRKTSYTVPARSLWQAASMTLSLSFPECSESSFLIAKAWLRRS